MSLYTHTHEHFYELTKLEEYFMNLKNYYVGYSIKNGEIKMTYKVFYKLFILLFINNLILLSLIVYFILFK